eukprot:symbB.v1.2.039639.t1/scaffold6699.1/size16100/2
MAKLLEGHERRTFDLGEALSNTGKELLVLTNRCEDSGQSISDQLRQMDAMYSKPSEVRAETPVQITVEKPAAEVLQIECHLESSKGFCDIQPVWTVVSEYLKVSALRKLSFCKHHDWFQKFSKIQHTIQKRREKRVLEGHLVYLKAFLEKSRSRLLST